ncbi:hypothetical protein M0R45_015976 [Rubus argutus]|uniref:Uncharacterized protein n=1 Tax=Rubus argutus TaxID=59490 RepID=A0AAW1XR91_RUBAR
MVVAELGTASWAERLQRRSRRAVRHGPWLGTWWSCSGREEVATPSIGHGSGGSRQARAWSVWWQRRAKGTADWNPVWAQGIRAEKLHGEQGTWPAVRTTSREHGGEQQQRRKCTAWASRITGGAVLTTNWARRRWQIWGGAVRAERRSVQQRGDSDGVVWTGFGLRRRRARGGAGGCGLRRRDGYGRFEEDLVK